jgi:PKD repeat protein
MKKLLLSSIGVLFISLSLFAQGQQIDKSNARDGEDVEYCLTHKKNAALKLDPQAMLSLAKDEIIRQQEANSNVGEGKAVIKYIPVVFHLMHNNGVEKISDDQILDAFDILNRDYAMLNSDANSVHNDFSLTNGSATCQPSVADIQFVLATKAPDGTCFSGITHTVSPLSYSDDGTAQKNAIKFGNDVYQGEWGGSRYYLNIYICGEIGGAAGYTYNPSNWLGSGMDNGIWILHNYVGSIGTSTTYSSRALTHEVGHWLNLDHTWGPNNNPGNASSCSDDDAVTDTPNTIGVTSCALNENTCGPRANVENYMDYSYCSKMFSAGQVTRMRNSLNSSVGGRNQLGTVSNLTNTGADGNLYLCKADFEADKRTICAGNSIQFTDNSYNQVNGWTWTFTGGTPATSSVQDPLITYNTPGLYTVTLTATDGSLNDGETKTQYIRVLPSSSSLPFLEGFENYSTLSNIEEWEVENIGNNAKFDIISTTGHSSAKSSKLANFGQPSGEVDELISAPVNLSGVTSTTNMTLSFRYAYRQRSASNVEYLKVFISANCGDTWVQRKTLSGTTLGNQTSTSSWTPSSDADWTTVHMTNVTSSYWVDNFRYKFRFESDGGNNFYLDNINIYEGAPSDDFVSGVSELGEIEGLSLYPNPADNELNVKFNLQSNETVYVSVMDVTGKSIQNNVINANVGSNLVLMNTSTLSNGMYFLNITVGGISQVKQFIVK